MRLEGLALVAALVVSCLSSALAGRRLLEAYKPVVHELEVDIGWYFQDEFDNNKAGNPPLFDGTQDLEYMRPYISWTVRDLNYNHSIPGSGTLKIKKPPRDEVTGEPLVVFPAPDLWIYKGDTLHVKVINHLDRLNNPNPSIYAAAQAANTSWICPTSNWDACCYSMHWHGMVMRNSPTADGVPGITQHCVPTAGGAALYSKLFPTMKPLENIYWYNFTAESAGTYWYHSHCLDLGCVYTEWAKAHLVVLDPKYSFPQNKFIVDETIGLSDGETRPAPYLYPLGTSQVIAFITNNPTSGKEPIPDQFFVNGKGQTHCGSDIGDKSKCPYHITTIPQNAPVTCGKNTTYTCAKSPEGRVRLRFTAESGMAVFRVSIDGFYMIVFQIDGEAVTPTTVKTFVINSGQRYDVILCKDTTAANPNVNLTSFWLRATAVQSIFWNDAKIPTVKSIIQFEPVPSTGAPLPTSVDDSGYDIFGNIVPGADAPSGWSAWAPYTDPLNAATARIDPYGIPPCVLTPAPIKKPQRVFAEMIDIGYDAGTSLYVNGTLDPHTNGARASFNGIIARMSDLPWNPTWLELQARNIGPNGINDNNMTESFVKTDLLGVAGLYTQHNPDLSAGNAVGRSLDHVETKQIFIGEEVRIIYCNRDGGEHPIHTHGHMFWVLGRGDPGFDPQYGGIGYQNNNDSTIGLNCPDELFTQDWPANLFYATPQKRDTATVMAFSYLAIQFKADNPGVWIVHCHIDWHMATGLLMMLDERQPPWKIPSTKAPSSSYFNGWF